jgi:hypothetical protein
VGLVVIGITSQDVTFSGQLRYAYLESDALLASFSQHLPGRSLSAILIFLAIFPVSWVWIVVLLLAAWQYVLYKYHKAGRDVTEKVKESCYHAKVAVERSREHTIAAFEYEKQALNMVDAARRDARLAQSVRITDFFDTDAVAWSSLERITDPVRIMTEKAKDVKEHAEDVVEAEFGADDDDDEGGDDGDGDRSVGNVLVESAVEAVAACGSVKQQMEHAQATITQSGDAKAQVAKVRDVKVQYAKSAEETLLELAKHIKDMSDDLSIAIKSFERVNWFADQAKALATQGELALAATWYQVERLKWQK